MVRTTGAAAATCSGLSAVRQPAAAAASSGLRPRFQASTSKPARARFTAMGSPIAPSPRKPTVPVSGVMRRLPPRHLDELSPRRAGPMSRGLPTTSRLTTKGGTRPAATSSTARTALPPFPADISSVHARACGLSTTWSMPSNGLSGAGGSLSNTSSPAPLIRRTRSASISAPSSTMGPRATLRRTAVGFISDSRRASTR